MCLFTEWLLVEQVALLTEGVLLEAKVDDTDMAFTKKEINNLLSGLLRELVDKQVIKHPDHIKQAEEMLVNDFDWWNQIGAAIRTYPYKGPDRYNAITSIAGDLARLFSPNSYRDQCPPRAVFQTMLGNYAKQTGFNFFSWRRKCRPANWSDFDVTPEVEDQSHDGSIEWDEIQNILMKSMEQEVTTLGNTDRAKRALDVAKVKLTGYSPMLGRKIVKDGLDPLANSYNVPRQEMYATLLVFYRAVKNAATKLSKYGYGDQLLAQVLTNLPEGLRKEPEEVILELIPLSGEISHSELFSKAYALRRDLKALTFRKIIDTLIQTAKIVSRKDDRPGKHQQLYRLL